MKSLKLSLCCRQIYRKKLTRTRLPRWPETSALSNNSSQIIFGNHFVSNISRLYCCNTITADNVFKPTIEIAEIPNLTDEELFKIIEQLRDLCTRKTAEELKHSNENSFIKAIDTECVRRARLNWDLEKTLDVLDTFYPKGKFLCPDLLFWLLKARFSKAMKSEPAVMMKYVSTIEKYYRFWTAYFLNCFIVENALSKNLDQLDLSQVSSLLNILILRSFKIVNQELTFKLYDKLMKEIDVVDSRVLNIFLLLFNQQPTSIDFTMLINNIYKKLPESHEALVQNISTLCVVKKIYHVHMLNELATYLEKQLPDININTLDILITSLSFFNFKSRDLYQKLIDNFEVEPLRSRVLEHPKRFVKIISNLCLIGVYPFNHIDQVLSRQFLQNTFGKKLSHHNVVREVMIIDGCVKGECPDYEGHKLDENLENNLTNRWSSHIHHYLQTEGDTSIAAKSINRDKRIYKPTPYNETILHSRKILRDILGGVEYVHACYVLPFLPKPNLLFCLDRQKHPVKLPDQILNSIRISYTSLDKSVDWFVVMPVNQHPLLKSDNFIIYGKDIAKERILKKNGFNVITVIPELWLAWQEEQKKSYFDKAMQ